MKYLIVVCEELLDQCECDIYRTPYKVTNDWQRDYPKNELFEVYEIHEDGSLTQIKEYDEYMEKGMAFGYWTWDDEEDTFHLIEKYRNKDRDDKAPKKVQKFFAGKHGVDDRLLRCGYITWEKSDCRVYIYGEYHDETWPSCD